MIPLLGGVTFAMLGVFALGGATAAVARGLRQEHPAPAPASVPVPAQTVLADRAEGDDGA